MPLSGKHLADAGLSTSMMVAFAIPGGAPFGAAIAVGQFLFDALMDIFTPPPVPPPPPLTQAELNAALTEVKADIIDAIWKDDADDLTADLLALNKGFNDVWARNQASRNRRPESASESASVGIGVRYRRQGTGVKHAHTQVSC